MKRKLADMIQKNQIEVRKIQNIKNTSNNLIKIIESGKKENVLSSLRKELNQILTK